MLRAGGKPLAEAAAAEKLKFVLEVCKAAFLRDLLFEMFHWTGDIENLDGSAVSADEIVLMMILAQAVMRRAAVEADAADDAALLETAHEPIDRSGITRHIEGRARCDLLQRHGLVRRGEDFQAGLKSCRPSKAGCRTLRKEVTDTGCFATHTRKSS